MPPPNAAVWFRDGTEQSENGTPSSSCLARLCWKTAGGAHELGTTTSGKATPALGPSPPGRREKRAVHEG